MTKSAPPDWIDNETVRMYAAPGILCSTPPLIRASVYMASVSRFRMSMVSS